MCEEVIALLDHIYKTHRQYGIVINSSLEFTHTNWPSQMLNDFKRERSEENIDLSHLSLHEDGAHIYVYTLNYRYR